VVRVEDLQVFEGQFAPHDDLGRRMRTPSFVDLRPVSSRCLGSRDSPRGSSVEQPHDLAIDARAARNPDVVAEGACDALRNARLPFPAAP